MGMYGIYIIYICTYKYLENNGRLDPSTYIKVKKLQHPQCIVLVHAPLASKISLAMPTPSSACLTPGPRQNLGPPR